MVAADMRRRTGGASVSLSLTPGFSPVLRREVEFNRFSGFGVAESR